MDMNQMQEYIRNSSIETARTEIDTYFRSTLN